MQRKIQFLGRESEATPWQTAAVSCASSSACSHQSHADARAEYKSLKGSNLYSSLDLFFHRKKKGNSSPNERESGQSRKMERHFPTCETLTRVRGLAVIGGTNGTHRLQWSGKGEGLNEQLKGARKKEHQPWICEWDPIVRWAFRFGLVGWFARWLSAIGGLHFILISFPNSGSQKNKDQIYISYFYICIFLFCFVWKRW